MDIDIIQVEPENHLAVYQNFAQIYRFLRFIEDKQEGNTLRQNIYWISQYLNSALKLINSLENDNKNLEKLNSAQQENSNKLLQENDRLTNENQRILEEYNALAQVYNQQSQEIDEIKKQLKELSIERGELISNMVKLQRNREMTTDLGEEDRPQNHLLVQSYRAFEEQDLHFVSSTIFNYGLRSNLFLRENRAIEIAKIKSILSRMILVKGIEIFTQNAAFTTIRNMLNQELKIMSGAPQEIMVTDNLIEKGLDLVSKIATADPPGQLWVEEGILFNPACHKPVIGCEARGNIEFTVYPGYRVGSHIFEKAHVFTTG